GREAQHLGRGANPSLDRLHYIEHHANHGPETRVLAAQVQSAVTSRRSEVVLFGQRLRRCLMAHLKIEGLAQTSQGSLPVLVLRSALLGDDDQATRQVAQAYCRASLVALLATGTTRPVRVHSTLVKQLSVAQGCPGGSVVQ